MEPLRTIIIDDEAIARQRLIGLLKKYNHRFTIIGEARNGIEGSEMVNLLKPDLIFLDIQMPGKTGFEMLEDLEYLPKIVFCTAYESYALQAFETMALDYLVKPVEAERIQLTIDKIDQNRGDTSSLHVKQLLDLVKQQTVKNYLHSIPHKIGDRILLIKIENITRFAAKEKYVEFYTVKGEKYLTELSLKKLQERLPADFVQVQRGLIVNMGYVKEFRKYLRGKYILVLDDRDNTRVETGRSFADTVKGLISTD
jgi:two-component system, LytTR family, response regulator